MSTSSVGKYATCFSLGLLVGIIGWDFLSDRPIVQHQVKQEDKTHEIRQQLSALSTRIDRSIQISENLQRSGTVVSVVDIKPDGSRRIETRKRFRSASQATQHTTEKSREEKSTAGMEQNVRETRVVLEPLLPSLRFSADVGYSMPRLFGRGEGWSLLKSKGLVGGLRVERRLYQNVWGGLFANTAGVAGVAISAEFQ